MELADLKVQELLKEVSVDFSKTKPLDDAIAVIRDYLLSLPEEEIKATTASAFIKDLGAPIDKVDFKFRKPESIKVFGSYALKAAAKPLVNVDLAVQMPKACFLQKDFLNHRYHAKRCLYLSVIKRHLHSCSVVKQIGWGTFCEDARKPILVIYPGEMGGDIGNDFVIRIIPTVMAATFELSKLAPSRNNVRAFQQDGVTQATPHYNSSILEDMFLEEHAAFLQKSISESESFTAALLLLKVWARQRNSINTPDCLNGFLMSIILAHLTTEGGGRRITTHMTGLQAFRVVMDFIAISSTLEKGIFMQPKSVGHMSSEQKRQFLQFFDIVICDPSGYLNIAFRMTKSGLVELRNEAAKTLTYMNTCKDRGFEEVFMTKIDYPVKFDYHARINPVDIRNPSNICLDREHWRVYEKEVELLLSKGLGERVRLIRVIPRSIPAKWTIDEGHLCLAKIPLLVGILVSNFEKAFRMVDVGPSADNKVESAKFRSFWGEKAQLRRFKDGKITETAVWECEQWEKHLIMKKIMKHILCQHLSLSSQDVSIVADQLDFSLAQGGKDPIAYTSSVLDAFDVLSKRLKSLDELPLKISSVQSLDSAFRHTSVFPPMPHSLSREKLKQEWSQILVSTCVQPLEVMIQLEGSGKWPVGDIAIEKTKAAFCLKIAESMQKRWGILPVAAEDAVDLLMGGFAFRLRILYEKDKSLLKKQVGNMLWSNSVPVEKDLLLRSQHSSMLNGLHGLHPTYGPTVRLAKRWICSHLFSGFLADEVVELLVAYLFVKPSPFDVPLSRVTGFLRFLRLLALFEWAMLPLIVDVNGELTMKERDQIMAQFVAKRKESHGQAGANNGGPAMYIATPYDLESESWTSLFPNNQVLKRLIAYARSSSELLTRLINGEVHNGWESLFRTPLQCYDALIHLHRDKLAYPHQMLFKSEISQGSVPVATWSASEEFNSYFSPAVYKGGFGEARKHLLVGFDPVKCFLDDLKTHIPKVLNVWHDALGSEVMGLMWNKEAFFTKNAGHKRKREDSDPIVLDARNILIEIGDLGEGLVKSVHLLKLPI